MGCGTRADLSVNRKRRFTPCRSGLIDPNRGRNGNALRPLARRLRRLRDHRDGANLAREIYSELRCAMGQHDRIAEPRIPKMLDKIIQTKQSHFECGARPPVEYKIVEFLESSIDCPIDQDEFPFTRFDSASFALQTAMTKVGGYSGNPPSKVES